MAKTGYYIRVFFICFPVLACFIFFITLRDIVALTKIPASARSPQLCHQLHRRRCTTPLQFGNDLFQFSSTVPGAGVFR